MKKSFFFLPLALALFSCSNDDAPANPGENPANGEYETSYLTVNIVTASDVSRVTPNDTNGSYADGVNNENAVDNLRLYFFDADDQPAKVVYGAQYHSYFDYTNPVQTGAGDAPNVEKIVAATVVISTPKGDKLPAKVIAVANLSESDRNDLGDASLAALRATTANYASNSRSEYVANNYNFLMTSSVYRGSTAANADLFDAVALTQDNFKTTEDDAKKSPVDIYIERVLAKVSVRLLNMTKDETAQAYKVMVQAEDGDQYTLNQDGSLNQAVFVKFLGWNVTTEAPKSHLIKNLKAGYSLGSWTDWNNTAYHRSFWATNADFGTDPYRYTTFNSTASGARAGNDVTSVEEATTNAASTNFTYAQENAVNETTDKPTQVIVAAQLVGSDGTALSIAEFLGAKYFGNDYLANLKVAIANVCGVYLETTEGTTKTYKSIKDYIDFKTTKEIIADNALKTVWDAGENPFVSMKSVNYYSWAVKVDNIPADTKFVKLSADGNSYVEVTDLNAELCKLMPIKIWKDGNTYYYVDIKHLGAANATGEYGVIRNHWYDIAVNRVVGLGTPVYKEDEEIIPETPDDDPHYLATKINILSWRIVSSNAGVQLGK